jgi:light-regulated signal transduction histidine kinase (bacteriophytochrome)
MSHAVLRSVSPIHVEYLRNMGVQASMSVSIVVRGELWGLIACHHMYPLQVPYSVRMACDVLAHVLASSVTAISARREAEFAADGNALLSQVVGAVSAGDDVLAALRGHAAALRQLLGADALVLAEDGKLLADGDLPMPLAKAVTACFQDDDRLRQWTAAEEWPASAASLPAAGWCGLLALPFDKSTRGVLVALRREQVEEVRWGGQPQKTATLGPHGARLTPRGSFTEWKETVRGRCVPWNAVQLDIAQRLLAELQRACNARHAETQFARRQLLAMLGHDLRDPLQSISMVAAMMKRTDEAKRLGHRLASSSGRMQRLISQVMDMSRLDAGMALTSRPQPTDLVALVRDLIEEARVGHPGVSFDLNLPGTLVAQADADRVAQLIGNLISNARHHGASGEPIELTLCTRGTLAELRVANVAPPIAEERVPHLFTPFRARDESALLNRSGLGLGLHIASKIAAEHGGTLEYAYEDGRVCFYARLPLAGDAGDAPVPAA